MLRRQKYVLSQSTTPFACTLEWPQPLALHCRATLCRTTFSKTWRGVTRESRYTPSKGPVVPTFSALKGGVALQVASWKASRYRVVSQLQCHGATVGHSLRLLNALNSEDRGLKVRFSLAMIVFETFELILCQMLSSQGKNAPSNPYPHYLVRLAASRLRAVMIINSSVFLKRALAQTCFLAW